MKVPRVPGNTPVHFHDRDINGRRSPGRWNKSIKLSQSGKVVLGFCSALASRRFDLRPCDDTYIQVTRQLRCWHRWHDVASSRGLQRVVKLRDVSRLNGSANPAQIAPARSPGLILSIPISTTSGSTSKSPVDAFEHRQSRMHASRRRTVAVPTTPSEILLLRHSI